MKPTKIYVQEVIKLIDKNLINGCANITGGGLADNIIRIIPNNLVAEINLNKIRTTKIFKWLKSKNISNQEMMRTFNCGIGFCLIVPKKNILKIQKVFSKKYKPYEIGIISKENKKLNIFNYLKW